MSCYNLFLFLLLFVASFRSFVFFPYSIFFVSFFSHISANCLFSAFFDRFFFDIFCRLFLAFFVTFLYFFYVLLLPSFLSSFCLFVALFHLFSPILASFYVIPFYTFCHLFFSVSFYGPFCCLFFSFIVDFFSTCFFSFFSPLLVAPFRSFFVFFFRGFSRLFWWYVLFVFSGTFGGLFFFWSFFVDFGGINT